MWYNPLIKFLLRSPLHGFASSSILLVSYTGRKTGRRYTVPLSYVHDGDELLIVSSRKRTWWRSLQGGAPVSIRLKGRDRTATAQAITGPDEVERDFGIYLQKVPYLARHLKIDLDDEGRPDPAGLAEAAKRRVMVRVRLEDA